MTLKTCFYAQKTVKYALMYKNICRNSEIWSRNSEIWINIRIECFYVPKTAKYGLKNSEIWINIQKNMQKQRNRSRNSEIYINIQQKYAFVFQ